MRDRKGMFVGLSLSLALFCVRWDGMIGCVADGQTHDQEKLWSFSLNVCECKSYPPFLLVGRFRFFRTKKDEGKNWSHNNGRCVRVQGCRESPWSLWNEERWKKRWGDVLLGVCGLSLHLFYMCTRRMMFLCGSDGETACNVVEMMKKNERESILSFPPPTQ